MDIQIILLGLQEEPEPGYICKDKFLIITLPVTGELQGTVAENWAQLESENKKRAISKKIKVKYNFGSKQHKDEKVSPVMNKVHPVKSNTSLFFVLLALILAIILGVYYRRDTAERIVEEIKEEIKEQYEEHFD